MSGYSLLAVAASTSSISSATTSASRSVAAAVAAAAADEASERGKVYKYKGVCNQLIWFDDHLEHGAT